MLPFIYSSASKFLHQKPPRQSDSLIIACHCVNRFFIHVYVMQFESIANFGAVIDRLGEFQEVLESSATTRTADTDTSEASVEGSQHPSFIQLVDQAGLSLCQLESNTVRAHN